MYNLLIELSINYFHPFYVPPPVHPYFYLSTRVFTHPNNGVSGLCIKLWAPEIIRNCIRHRPEAEHNQSCRSALTVCWIIAVL